MSLCSWQKTFSNGKGETMITKTGIKLDEQATVLSKGDIIQTYLLYQCAGTHSTAFFYTVQRITVCMHKHAYMHTPIITSLL